MTSETPKHPFLYSPTTHVIVIFTLVPKHVMHDHIMHVAIKGGFSEP